MAEPRLCYRYAYRALVLLVEPVRLAYPKLGYLKVVIEIEWLVSRQEPYIYWSMIIKH